MDWIDISNYAELVSIGFFLVLKFIWENFFQIVGYYMLAINVHGLNIAFKGGNGTWQLKEVSKALLWILLIIMVQHNISLKEPFSEGILILMLFIQIIQAEMKEVITLFLQFKGGVKIEPTTDSSPPENQIDLEP